MTIYRNHTAPPSPKKVPIVNMKYRHCMKPIQPCTTPESSFASDELRVVIISPPSQSYHMRSYCRRRPHHRRQNAVFVGNNELNSETETAELSEERKPTALAIVSPGKIAGPDESAVSLDGARSSSIPMKLKLERSSSPTTTMMEIETSIEDEDDQQTLLLHKPKVRFVEVVKVSAIPNRREYTSQQRYQMWNSSAAIRHMAQKNTIEYNWEGRDWRQAAEEESFFQYCGSFVHPAHYRSACDHQKQLAATAAATTMQQQIV